jgi:Flp pilus assembly protein TadG
MRGIFELLNRFRADERGVFAVIFGLMAIVLVAMAGAAVDYTSLENARTRTQIALDSAALGLQPKIFATTPPTEVELKDLATALIAERLNDTTLVATATAATFNVGSGTLHLEAKVTVPMAFVQLVGISNITANVVSEATRKRLNLEVAMVLDNSGSMGSNSRMTNLKKAALCAMNVLYNALDECTDAKVAAANGVAATETNIWLGIVPFTGFVNVGAGYKTATWMDTNGLSSIANDNFDDDDNDTTPYTGTVNRFALYTAMGVTWRGCVEARPYPYDTDDTVPSSANPDTLFVPEFAPDTPDSGGYSNNYKNDRPAACTNDDAGSWVQTSIKTECTATWGNNVSEATKASTYSACGSTPTTSLSQTNWDGSNVSPPAATAPATMPDRNGVAIPSSCAVSYSSVRTSKSPNRYRLTYTNTCSYQFPDRVLQERLCKYTGSISGGGSPNQDCPTNALTPLTATKATIKTAIDAMSPQGYTNIHQGTIWGFHMLSPTEPLTQGKSYEDATSKVMIIMTDGENTVDSYGANMNNANTFQAYGWPGAPSTTGGISYNGRIFSTLYPQPSSDDEVTAAMDSRTLEACTNAKFDDRIKIYTIGLSAPNQKTIDLLTDCATEPAMAYFPTDPTELTAVFKTIADQLSNLRLSL